VNADQHATMQRILAENTVAYASQFANLFQAASLSRMEWLKLLALLYPQVKDFQERSAALAREFYDSERGVFHPELPRHNVLLEPYTFQWFVKNMEPARKLLSAEKSPPAAVTRFALQVASEVIDSGREQIIHSVQSDDAVKEKVAAFEQRSEKLSYDLKISFGPRPEVPEVEYTGPKLVASQGENRPVLGWARIATGRETCAWCLMLVSRGAVYYSAQNAGLKLDDESAKDAILGGTDVSDLMAEWHVGCDCLVVPVFDLANWSGKEAADRALELWVEADEEAERFVEENPGRVHKTGKKRGLSYTKNEEIQLALRRKIDRGEISPQEWAALSEAA
jgi:hypothetical protein